MTILHTRHDGFHGVDLVGVVLEQHGQIRHLCAAVAAASPAGRARPFNDLRAMITAHEATEQAVVRPKTLETAGESTVGDREAEERAIKAGLLDVGRIPTASAEFGIRFSRLVDLITEHLEAEEREELPHLLAHYSPDERRQLGRLFIHASRWAPSDPGSIFASPTATHALLGPVAALIHRTRNTPPRQRDRAPGRSSP